jgi:hypothetical protein
MAISGFEDVMISNTEKLICQLLKTIKIVITMHYHSLIPIPLHKIMSILHTVIPILTQCSNNFYFTKQIQTLT